MRLWNIIIESQFSRVIEYIPLNPSLLLQSMTQKQFKKLQITKAMS